MYANFQNFAKEFKISEEILQYARVGPNPKEIKEISPFSLKNLIDDYIKIEIYILSKEIERRSSTKQSFFVEGVNENLRKRLKGDWLRWWDEN